MATSFTSPSSEHQHYQNYQQHQLHQQYQQYCYQQQSQSQTQPQTQTQPQPNSQQSPTETSRKIVNHDVPPFSRVFIVCSKNMKEEEIKESFAVFGAIEDIWMVKDRMTKENKGICYVKYDKASAAAKAIEEMDGRVIGSDPKPIKVTLRLLYTYMYIHLHIRIHICTLLLILLMENITPS